MSSANIKTVTAITKALSDPNRLRILMMLRGRELCVCQITEVLSLAPSTVSKHLALLSQADLILARKEGRWVHYRLPDHESVEGAVGGALDWILATAAGEAEVRTDAEKLQRVLCMTPEELCQQQSARRDGACCGTNTTCN